MQRFALLNSWPDDGTGQCPSVASAVNLGMSCSGPPWSTALAGSQLDPVAVSGSCL
jgi:hypothetical protein